MKDIKDLIFEKLERFNINVNVFSYENRVRSFYTSKNSNEQELNVLLISNKEKSH